MYNKQSRYLHSTPNLKEELLNRFTSQMSQNIHLRNHNKIQLAIRLLFNNSAFHRIVNWLTDW